MHQSAKLSLAASIALAVAACGGGGGGGSSGSSSTAATSGAITGFGSIIVADKRLSVANATISQDDDSLSESDLEIGETVCVTDDDTGRHVEVEEVLRGPVDSVSGNTITAMQQTIETDPVGTAFDDTPASDPGNLFQDDIIEVGGLRTATGAIDASFVEKKSTNDNDYTVTGRVQNHDTGVGTFQIGSLIVDYNMSGAADTGDMPAGNWDGLLVEVEDSTRTGYNRGTSTLVATKVEPENEACGDVGQLVEVERIITAVDTAGDGIFAEGETFELAGGLTVDSTGAEYRLGLPVDVVVGARVEVEGILQSEDTLLADKIKFDDNDARLSGIAQNIDVGAGTLEVLGVTISLAASGVEFDGDKTVNGLGDLISGTDFVEVEGRIGPNGVVAYEIEQENDATRDRELRGTVTAKNKDAGTLTILGIDLTAGGSTQYEAEDELPLTKGQFFDRITLKATIVEATWDGDTFTDTSNAPKELEIEEDDDDD